MYSELKKTRFPQLLPLLRTTFRKKRGTWSLWLLPDLQGHLAITDIPTYLQKTYQPSEININKQSNHELYELRYMF